MLSTMNSTRRTLLIISVFFVAILFAGCGQVASVPMATATIAPSLTSSIPSIIPTATLFLTVAPTSTPDFCDSKSWDVPWIILSYDAFHAFGATSGEIDEQLVLRNPQWQGFRQTVTTEPWTAGDIFVQGHGAPGEYGVNPSVLLVTVGIDLEWQIPSDGDLYSKVVETGETLYAYYQDYYTQEDVRDAYPQIGNAATYSLYRFFNQDVNRLNQWKEEYQSIFPAVPSLSLSLSLANSQITPFLRRPFDQPSGTFYAVTSMLDHSYPMYSNEGNDHFYDYYRFDGTP